MISSQTLDAIVAIGTAASDVAQNGPAFKKGLVKLQAEKDAIDTANATLKATRVKVDAGVKEGKELLAAIASREARVVEEEARLSNLSDNLDEAKAALLKQKVAAHATLARSKSGREELTNAQSKFTTMFRVKTENLDKRETDLDEREAKIERIEAAIGS